MGFTNQKAVDRARKEEETLSLDDGAIPKPAKKASTGFTNQKAVDRNRDAEAAVSMTDTPAPEERPKKRSTGFTNQQTVGRSEAESLTSMDAPASSEPTTARGEPVPEKPAQPLEGELMPENAPERETRPVPTEGRDEYPVPLARMPVTISLPPLLAISDAERLQGYEPNVGPRDINGETIRDNDEDARFMPDEDLIETINAMEEHLKRTLNAAHARMAREGENLMDPEKKNSISLSVGLRDYRARSAINAGVRSLASLQGMRKAMMNGDLPSADKLAKTFGDNLLKSGKNFRKITDFMGDDVWSNLDKVHQTGRDFIAKTKDLFSADTLKSVMDAMKTLGDALSSIFSRVVGRAAGVDASAVAASGPSPG